MLWCLLRKRTEYRVRERVIPTQFNVHMHCSSSEVFSHKVLELRKFLPILFLVSSLQAIVARLHCNICVIFMLPQKEKEKTHKHTKPKQQNFGRVNCINILYMRPVRRRRLLEHRRITVAATANNNKINIYISK